MTDDIETGSDESIEQTARFESHLCLLSPIKQTIATNNQINIQAMDEREREGETPGWMREALQDLLCSV
ncbi:hypothetical protein EYC84_010954 [Monilinia fructicola]|uniref:Uncharacterized protein n=1 Tax=Monilinia fructicola TaxID=38448 RepID=A0A5M9J7S2_MONFR|nr:hypothetical protein EYC84_010954 [Monilinia fructicola]